MSQDISYNTDNDHSDADISFGIVVFDVRASMLSSGDGRGPYTARYGSEGLSSKSRAVGLGVRGESQGVSPAICSSTPQYSADS